MFGAQSGFLCGTASWWSVSTLLLSIVQRDESRCIVCLPYEPVPKQSLNRVCLHACDRTMC
jgi:hypothetical protein